MTRENSSMRLGDAIHRMMAFLMVEWNSTLRGSRTLTGGQFPLAPHVSAKGSIVCGNFAGPHEAGTHPKDPGRVVEEDLIVFLGRPPQPNEVRTIMELLGFDEAEEVPRDYFRIGLLAARTMAYKRLDKTQLIAIVQNAIYQPRLIEKVAALTDHIPNNCVVLLELNIVSRDEWVELGHVWGRLFSKQQIDWQKRARITIRKAITDGSANLRDLGELKRYQCDMARWIYLQGLTHGIFDTGGVPQQVIDQAFRGDFPFPKLGNHQFSTKFVFPEEPAHLGWVQDRIDEI